LTIKKATGYDGISPKILQLSMPCIDCRTLFTITVVLPIFFATLLKKSLKTSDTFAGSLQVRPLFKKKNILEKGNYRPVSILPTISKFVERAIFDQLADFFNFLGDSQKPLINPLR
jgi:hypothetical protein